MSAPAEDTFVNDPAADYAMADLFACDRCHKASLLFAGFVGQKVCSECWHALGSPFPRREAAPQDVALAEQRNRERMLKRNGADRHMVRSGKS